MKAGSGRLLEVHTVIILINAQCAAAKAKVRVYLFAVLKYERSFFGSPNVKIKWYSKLPCAPKNGSLHP